MATPRRRYRVDVTLLSDRTYGAVIRRSTTPLGWGYCPHAVRATSRRGAEHRAIQEHQQQAGCAALDAQIRDLWRRHGMSGAGTLADPGTPENSVT
jgi:hypothetical protein